LAEALGLTGGAAAGVRETLEALEVREDRMRANLEATGGRLLSERIVLALAPAAGRAEAVGAVQAAAVADGAFRDALLGQPVVAEHLGASELDDLLDPAGYLGATGALIERALARCEREIGMPAS
jgi:3-carboxy-cis,cis-muconate cycloisomerase